MEIKIQSKIVENEGLIQQSDPKEIEKIISEVLSKNQDKVTQYKSGKEKLFGYFVGEVMKISKGKSKILNLLIKFLKVNLNNMLKNIEVTQDLLDYIYNNTKSLDPLQKNIIDHNKNLGDVQRMQISEIQAHFLQLIIKNK